MMELKHETRNMDLVRAMGAQATMDAQRRPIMRVMAMWGASKQLENASILMTPKGAVVSQAGADAAVKDLQPVVLGLVCQALRLDRLRDYAASEGADVGVIGAALDAIVQGDEPEIPSVEGTEPVLRIAP